MMSKLAITLTAAFLTVFIQVNGQQNINLPQAIDLVEQKQKVKFFYRHEWIQHITVDRTLTDRPLVDFLKESLQGTGLHYILHQKQYVILLKDFKDTVDIKTALALDEKNFIPDGRLYTIRGNIKDANTGESITGASVFIEEKKIGTSTNTSGFYSITLPSGVYTLKASAIGRVADQQKIILRSDMQLHFNLFDQVTQLRDVEITAEAADENISSIEMSLVKLDAKNIKSMPSFLGEPDIVKSVTLLPGVKTVGEGAGGFNVRGGNVDQNLVLLDDVPIFNTSHLFGFFSAFNTEAVKDISLFKGGIPAQYGGRISSVLDVRLKDGNAKNFEVRGSAGIISSKLFLEGPIVKNKTSFILGGRYAYPDWVIKRVPDLDIQRSSGMFYDVTAKFHHEFNEKNNLSLSAFLSEDQFKLAGDTLYGWNTKNMTFKWNSVLSKKIFVGFTALYSNYEYYINGQRAPDLYTATFGVLTRGAKVDFTYAPDLDHKVEFGASANRYDFSPGKMDVAENSAINSVSLPLEQSDESALYVSDEIKLHQNVTVSAGVRLSHYRNIGPGNVFIYQEGAPQSVSTIVDTVSFSSGKPIRQYSGVEPRLSVRLALDDQSSIKASYNRNIQYLHLISNTAAISPLDLWKSSNYHIKPETGNQFAVGYFRNLKNNMIETSLEIYYKEVENMLEYKDGADLFLNPAIESALLPAFGKAYGAELLVRKNAGKLTGWVGYTYSRTLRQVQKNTGAETINKGKFYPSNVDKPHDLAVVANYKFTRRISMSANFTYNTGRPITYPDEVYVIDGYTFTQFSDRNQGRTPDYHRLDISFTLEGNLKQAQKYKGSWTLSIFNVYRRKNAYSIFFKPEYRGARPQAYRLSVLGSVFPSLTYNFKIN